METWVGEVKESITVSLSIACRYGEPFLGADQCRTLKRE
jgi:hypothetical protein